MTPTRPRTLVAVAVVCAAAAWLAVRASYAGLPALPWTAIPALLLLAFGEVLIGRNLVARRRGRRSSKPLEPMAVARLAALAKASSVVAAIFGGLAAGFVIYVAGSLDKAVPRHDAIAALVTLAAAGALVAAALYLEQSCRAPRPPGNDEGTPPRS
jgi:Protein of unknown function (DUF3180)